ELSKLLICRALRTAKYERGRHAGFAGGVGIGGLPSIRQGDGKFFAATPPASGLRVCHLDSWHSRSFLLSDRTIVPGPARPVLLACRRQTGPVRPRKKIAVGFDRAVPSGAIRIHLIKIKD